MSKPIILFALITIAFVHRGDTVSTGTAGSPPTHFCYTTSTCDETTAAWGGACKSGQSQSPINLPATLVPLGLAALVKAAANKALPRQALSFNNGYKADSFYVVDNGHTVQIQLESTGTSSAEMTGYQLNDDYEFAQAHLHWGDTKNGGSEHTLAGKRFTGEIHFVHFLKQYGSVAAAAASGDPKGLAVVAVFIEHTIIPLVGQKGNEAMKPITENLPVKYSPNATHVNKPIDLGLILPKSGDVVHRYNGSLTTPGCSEVVIWTVAEKPLKVNLFKLLPFLNVEDEEGEKLGKNFRSLQALNNRKVERFIVQ